jgi:prolipoprotein diacylglyceryl transferase
VRPELFTLPGTLLKVAAPLLILWGVVSLVLYALFVRGRAEPRAEADEPASGRAPTEATIEAKTEAKTEAKVETKVDSEVAARAETKRKSKGKGKNKGNPKGNPKADSQANPQADSQIAPEVAPEVAPKVEVGAAPEPAKKPFRLVVDNPLNAALTIVAGLLLARYASTAVESLSGLFSVRAWTAPWRAVPLHSYGVMLGLSLVAGWNVTLPLAVRLGFAREKAADCYVVTAAAAIVGSRVLYVLTNFAEFTDPATGSLSLPAMVSLRTGGLVAYGGFLGGLVGSWWYLRRQGLSLKRWADAAVPSLALGLAITRIGCFLYGCDFGTVLPHGAPSLLVRAGTFPRWDDGRGSPAWAQHTLDGFRVDAARCVQQFNGDFRDGLCHLSAHAHASAPVHPTQLYESLFSWALLGVLAWTWKRRRFDGQVLLVATIGYGVGRTLIEFIRDDRSRGGLAGLSTSQWIGLATAALAAGLWRRWSAKA